MRMIMKGKFYAWHEEYKFHIIANSSPFQFILGFEGHDLNMRGKV